MEKPTFEFYTRPNGHNEFMEFMNTLPKIDREKLFATIDKVQRYGLITSKKMKWIKKISGNLFELRSNLGTNIQRSLYFHAEENHFVITHGFSKKTQKTPVKEIHHAELIRNEYLEEHTIDNN